MSTEPSRTIVRIFDRVAEKPELKNLAADLRSLYEEGDFSAQRIGEVANLTLNETDDGLPSA